MRGIWFGLTGFESITQPEEDPDDVGDENHTADIYKYVSLRTACLSNRDRPCEKPDESLDQSAVLLRDSDSCSKQLVRSSESETLTSFV